MKSLRFLKFSSGLLKRTGPGLLGSSRSLSASEAGLGTTWLARGFGARRGVAASKNHLKSL